MGAPSKSPRGRTEATGRRPVGVFQGEESCRCGFIVNEYDDGRYAIEYADPDTGLVIDRCPKCGRDLNLRGQA